MKPYFLNSLKLQLTERRKHPETGLQEFMLLEDFVWKDPDGNIIKIPQYFTTDGASIPKIGRMLIDPQGHSVLRAAVLHDHMYYTAGGTLNITYTYNYPKEYSRKEQDDIFKYMLKQDGLNKIKCYIVYWSVRLFGASSWGKRKK